MNRVITVDEVGRHEMGSAAGVLARGMRDNPVHEAAFGEDPSERRRILERFFGSFLPTMRRAPICARSGHEIVGVLGLAPPGTCQPPPWHEIRLLPAILRPGPAATVRTLRWFFQWQRRDPKERHWHLGPVAVEPELQGRGIGGRMMERFVEVVDADGGAAYLETDKPENVRLYEKFGFEVVEEATILDTPNWFMSRTTRTEAR